MRRASQLAFIVAWSWALSGCDVLNQVTHLTKADVFLDAASCPNAGTVQVTFDGGVIGTISPGEGTDNEVSPGPHTIAAQSTNKQGYVWPSAQFTVTEGSTFTYTLTCNKTHLIANVLNNCTGAERNVSVVVDGVSIGVGTPGGSGLTGDFIPGPHAIATYTTTKSFGPVTVETPPGTYQIGVNCP